MPIEIRELVIRAVVEDPSPGAPSQAPTRASQSDEERQQLIQLCVQQVMRLLRRERER